MKFSSYIAIIYINIVLWIKKLLKLKIIPYKTLINLTDIWRHLLVSDISNRDICLQTVT